MKKDKEKKELDAIKNIESDTASKEEIQGQKKVSREEFEKMNEEDSTLPLGYSKIPLENLPTRGLFYPEGTKIMIRAAETGEIRHWSTIDESDTRDIISHLNSIVKACTRIQLPEDTMEYRDLKEADRLFIILSIRDLTFKEGQNRIMMPVENPDTGNKVDVELKNNNLDVQDVDDKFMEYYSDEDNCFEISLKKSSEKYTIEPPSIGMSQKITDFISKQNKENSHIDKTFIRTFPFIEQDWRSLTHEKIMKEQNKSKTWNQVTVSVLLNFVEGIQVGQKPFLTHKFEDSAREVTVPIKFPGGIKSLFLISDIFEEIL